MSIEHNLHVLPKYETNTHKQVCQEIRDAGGEAISIAADCSKREEVHNMFQTAVDQYGKVDVLVNNAGIARDGLVVRMRPEQWQQVRTSTSSVQFEDFC